MTYLLTWHGTLLCHGPTPGAWRQGPLFLDPGVDRPVTLDAKALPSWPAPAARFARFLDGQTGPEAIDIAQGVFAGFRLTADRIEATVTLSRDGRFLGAAPDGAIRMEADQPGPMETFLPLSEIDLAMLRLILGNRWVAQADGAILPRAAIGLAEGFQLRMAAIRYDLRQQVPFDDGGPPMRLVLLRDGWRMAEYRLFRPLVYYAAFRDPVVLDQLALSIRSLFGHGRFDGHLHVLTDARPARIAAMAAGGDPAAVSVQSLQPVDRMAAVAGKFAVLEWEHAQRFQPLLFVDPDTVFDRDIAPLLAAVAGADRITALGEHFSPLRTATSVGATLFEEDGMEPGPGHGFNSGTLGIPNLRIHGHTLRLIRRIVMARGLAGGRNSWTWIDQPATNYVAVKTGGFDTAILQKHVRHGFAGVERDTAHARGLVHFWPPRDGRRKLEVMRAYLAALDASRDRASSSRPMTG